MGQFIKRYKANVTKPLWRSLTVSYKVKQIIPVWSVYPREMKTCVQIQTGTGMFVSALLVITNN